MWEFYPAGAESAFRVEKQVVFQIQLARKVDSVPLTHGYIAEREAAPRARDEAVWAAPPSVTGIAELAARLPAET